MSSIATIELDDDVFKTNDKTSGVSRSDVMTDDEIKEADKYIEWYKSSYKDKENRGLFDKWETIDLYWEGEAHPPESDTDPASNTNIINPNVEGQVAYLVEQNIAITTKATGPSELAYANLSRTVLEKVKYQNKLKRKLDVHERRREKFGTGIFRVLFDPDKLDGIGLPVIDPRNPAYIFPDPTITDVYSVQEGRFLIEVVNKSLNWARDEFDGNLVEAIRPGFHPMASEYLFGEEDGQSDEISRDSYMHMFVWRRNKKDGEKILQLVQMSGCGVILKNSLDDDVSFYPTVKYPYFFTPDMYREGTVWAKGSAELLVNTQDLIDDIDDQVRLNARLTGNPQRLVHSNSGIDPDKLTNEGGIAIVSDEADGIKWLEPPAMSEYIIRRRDQAIGVERALISRFSDQMNGISQQGIDTATESLGLQQAGNMGINHKKLLLEETLSEVFEYCLELCMEYWDEEQAFRLTEDEKSFVYFKPSELKGIPKLVSASEQYKNSFLANVEGAEKPPQYMPMPMTDELGNVVLDPMGQPQFETKKAVFDIEVTVGAGLPQNKGFIYNLIKEAYKDGALTLPEYRKLLVEFVGLPVDETMPVPELPPQMAQAPTGQMPNPTVAGLSAQGSPMGVS